MMEAESRCEQKVCREESDAGVGTVSDETEGSSPSCPLKARADLGTTRQEQRKQLNSDFRRLAATYTPQLSSCSDTKHMEKQLWSLVGDFCAAYRSFPLLCKRATKEAGSTDGPGPGGKKRKKRRFQNLKKHQRKRARGMQGRHPAGAGSPGHLNDSECHRCLAVAFNTATKRVVYGMSGQYKRVKIHPSLWGKSLVAGRPRGTCAEFRVANEVLSAGEKISDLVMAVADIMTGESKERCRNCLMITQHANVFSDSLKFDGDTTKSAKR